MLFPLFMRFFAIGCALVGVLHVTFGLGADNMLGAGLPFEVVSNPTLDSQNRFYGASFLLFGWVAWLCASDILAYKKLFHGMMAVFFLSGVARLISVFHYGFPSPPVIGLMAIELVLPPILLIWVHRVSN